MDRGDGRDYGQAEPEAIAGGAPVEPLEWLEDAAGVGRADDRAGIGHGQLAAACDGAGADPDVAAGKVIPDRVVDQVRDKPFGQYRIAGDDGGLFVTVTIPSAGASAQGTGIQATERPGVPRPG